MARWAVERCGCPDAYFALVGMLVSAYLQWKHIQAERDKEMEPEVEKEYIF